MTEYSVDFIKKEIRKAIAFMDDDDASYAAKLGFASATLKDLNDFINRYEKETIGETIVRWVRDDIVNEFSNRFERVPTSTELEDIIDNYLDLRAAGADSATEVGWDHIYSAIDEWERDNPQEEL